MRVAVRVFVIVVGGYAATSALVAAGTAGLQLAGWTPSDAFTLCSLLGFPVYAALAMWAAAAWRGPGGLSVRDSFNWLHTWAGVVVGALLFAIFWTGTLCVFDREIDRWMMPSTRLVYDGAPVSLDPLVAEATRSLPRAGNWSFVVPTEREPFVALGHRTWQGFERKYFDPATLGPLESLDTWAATRFFFPFHYTLHIKAWDIGIWLVGFAGVAMMALCVTGVVIHRKIFTDFFTLRRARQPHRTLLDLHNTAGTLGFVFHLVMAFSGVTILASVYLPAGVAAAFDGGRFGYVRATYDTFFRPPLKRPGPPIASLDAMVATAREAWDGLGPIVVRVFHPGDANAFVEIRPSLQAEVEMRTDPFYFDAATGAVLHRTTIRPLTQVQQFLTGLHFIQFRHWPLRWIYFLLGLLGCLLIATGFLFWLERRRKAHAAAGFAGVRIVEGIAAASTSGIIVATLAYFVANRLLAADATFLGGKRYELEIWAFFAVWLASLAHGWIRRRAAWAEQCWAAAILAVAAVVLNGLTTGDHIVRAFAQGKTAVALMDLVLLAGAAAAAVTAWRLAAAPRPHRSSLEGQTP
jgi:uncharacterized iron-regulated membrane protein